MRAFWGLAAAVPERDRHDGTGTHGDLTRSLTTPAGREWRCIRPGSRIAHRVDIVLRFRRTPAVTGSAAAVSGLGHDSGAGVPERTIDAVAGRGSVVLTTR